jgi:excisionase family DNA binding protein
MNASNLCQRDQKGKSSCECVDQDRLLKIKEVAELTGLSVGTLYHFVSQNRIPVLRLSRRCIRFRLSALVEWFDDLSHQVKPNQ